MRPRDDMAALRRRYAPMIMNPCGSTLYRGLLGSQRGEVAMRMRSSVSLAGFTGATGLVVLWDPATYVNNGGFGLANYGQDANLFYYAPNSGSLVPTAAGWGGSTAGTAMTTVGSFADPGQAPLNSVFTSASLISACMVLRYIGPASSIQGEVCAVTLPAREFYEDRPTIDQMFARAGKVHRLDEKDIEIVCCPPPAGIRERNRASESPLVTASAAGLSDAAYYAEYEPPTGQSLLYGFAVRFPTSGQVPNLRFDLVKNSEYKYDLTGLPGAVQQSETVVHTKGNTLLESIYESLSKTDPYWWFRSIKTMTDMGSAYLSLLNNQPTHLRRGRLMYDL